MLSLGYYLRSVLMKYDHPKKYESLPQPPQNNSIAPKTIKMAMTLSEKDDFLLFTHTTDTVSEY